MASKVTLVSANDKNVTANAAAGLFYGVETFVQLLKPRDGILWLPEGRIVDWPDLQLRQIYWDDAHHLDRLETLKKAIRQEKMPMHIHDFALNENADTIYVAGHNKIQVLEAKG